MPLEKELTSWEGLYQLAEYELRAPNQWSMNLHLIQKLKEKEETIGSCLCLDPPTKKQLLDFIHSSMRTDLEHRGILTGTVAGYSASWPSEDSKSLEVVSVTYYTKNKTVGAKR